MSTPLSALPAIAFLCASATWASCGVADDELLTAFLADGRMVTGTVNGRTDADFLWLARSGDQFDLVSGYPWPQVLAGRTGEQTLKTAELRTWALGRKQPGRKFADIAPVRQTDPQMRGAAPSPALWSAPAFSTKTLVIDAELGQWDKDAMTDGLRIFVAPLDAQGQLVPVNGHIELTLAVEREYTNRGQRYIPGPEFVEGERITVQVRKEHFQAGAAIYELPFSRWHPDYEPSLAHQALLHARLSVPGQGVFEASDAQVCLREPSRFRDQLQLYSAGRYLPLEHPSRDGR